MNESGDKEASEQEIPFWVEYLGVEVAAIIVIFAILGLSSGCPRTRDSITHQSTRTLLIRSSKLVVDERAGEVWRSISS